MDNKRIKKGNKKYKTKLKVRRIQERKKRNNRYTNMFREIEIVLKRDKLLWLDV